MTDTKQNSSNPKDRVVRVFISSTFRDMKEEREILVKRVFPQLRKLCEERGVVWGEVDLRWGVTDEQKAEGKVLPICLEEIKRCRPYFIGILGERYGWVPEAIHEDLIEREPWLKEQLIHSVTELEILHGVLRNPDMAEHAYFYFRDPAYLDRLPEDTQLSDFACESEKNKQKLAVLKERIRKSGFSVRENYPDPKALGKQVLTDFTNLINRLFPEDTRFDPLDRDRRDHAVFAQSRAHVYIERKDYLERLSAHARSTDPPLVILGESGSGKSALLANWALQYKKDHPEHLLIMHFIGASPYSADWASTLRRIMGELKRQFNIPREIMDKPNELRLAFANFLHMASAQGKVILIIDSLNQLEDREGSLDLVWLPLVIPDNVRLFLSTLPGRPLDALKTRAWPTLTVEPLNYQERGAFIERNLAQYTKALSPPRVERIANSKQTSNPLYLKVLLEELRLLGEHERLDDRIGHYLEAEDPYKLYLKVLARWQEDYDEEPGLVGNAFSFIWASRRGLTESELLVLLGRDGEPIPYAYWSPLFLAIRESLISRSGFLTFAHSFLRNAVQDTYVPSLDDQSAAHLRLADYFRKQELTPRQVDELPWQLREARGDQCLYDLLSNLFFLHAAWTKDQFDVKAYWSYLNEHNLSVTEAYRPVLENPGNIPDPNHVWDIAKLLTDTGHPAEAFSLRSHLVSRFREANDLNSLQASLGGQAGILRDWGRLDEAMALYKDQDRICGELGNRYGLQAALGSEAVILYAWGRLDEAIVLYREQERICRELENWDGLSISLHNQAITLYKWGSLVAAMSLLKEQERICRELGNIDGLQRSLGIQAVILYTWNKFDEAMTLYKEQERICRELGDRYSLQTSLGNQALISQVWGRPNEAMSLFKEQERICQEIGNIDGLQRSLGNQAGILATWGRLDEAMALYKDQERICKELGNQDELSNSLCGQALILKYWNRLNEAMSLLKKQERICRKLRNRHGLQSALGNQASILQAWSRLDEAMALYKDQEQICKELGNQDKLSYCLLGQATILQAWSRLDEAMTLYKKQERICKDLGNMDGLCRSLNNQATIFQTWDRLDEAMVIYKEQEQICKELGNRDFLQGSLGNQAVILQTWGRLDEAMALYKEQEKICREVGIRDGLQRTLGNQALILQDWGWLDEAMTLYKDQEQICREEGTPKGLAISLTNQALILTGKMDRMEDAFPLVEEALKLAIDHDLAALAEQIRFIMARLNRVLK